MQELLFLLLPVAAGYGWVMGRNSVRKAQRQQARIMSKHYYKGLNFLLSDQADRAVDNLIRMMSVNEDNIETHIAMGNLFRHRGELDRAIRIHQNLVGRQSLSDEQRAFALKELGKDYKQAGFFERAENVYLKLLESSKFFESSKKHLFEIYQTTKEWDKAIELADRVLTVDQTDQLTNNRLSHFYCEKAQALIKVQDFSQALPFLRKAQAADETSVRPWLMLGHLHIKSGQFNEAIEALSEVPQRDIEWFSEAVPMLIEASQSADNKQLLINAIEPYWQQCAASYLAKVRLQADDDLDAAVHTLVQQLERTPTMKGFATLLSLYAQYDLDERTQQSLVILQSLVSQQQKQRPKYRCMGCGFTGRQLHWLCPACLTWSQVKPIKGLDGE